MGIVVYKLLFPDGKCYIVHTYIKRDLYENSNK